MVEKKGRGGARPGAGRKPKSKDKATVEQRKTLEELARSHTDEAIDTLLSIMRDTGAPQSARVSASGQMLDRGYGKAPQALVHSGEVQVSRMSN